MDKIELVACVDDYLNHLMVHVGIWEYHTLNNVSTNNKLYLVTPTSLLRVFSCFA